VLVSPMKIHPEVPRSVQELAKASKITALSLGWVDGWVVRSDSRGSGAAGSFSQCAFCLDGLVTAGPRSS